MSHHVNWWHVGDQRNIGAASAQQTFPARPKDSVWIVSLVLGGTSDAQIQTPSGWTQIGDVANYSSPGVTTALFYRVIADSDQQGFTSTWSWTGNRDYVLEYCYALGINPSDPLATATATATGSSSPAEVESAEARDSANTFFWQVAGAAGADVFAYTATDADGGSDYVTSQRISPTGGAIELHTGGKEFVETPGRTKPTVTQTTSKPWAALVVGFNLVPTGVILRQVGGAGFKDVAGGTSSNPGVYGTYGGGGAYGCEAGDLVVMGVVLETASDPYIGKGGSGWTFLGSGGSTNKQRWEALYAKVVTNPNSEDWGFTWTGTLSGALGVLIFRGFSDVLIDSDASANTGEWADSDPDYTAPSTTYARTLYIGDFFFRPDTPPSSLTISNPLDSMAIWIVTHKDLFYESGLLYAVRALTATGQAHPGFSASTPISWQTYGRALVADYPVGASRGLPYGITAAVGKSVALPYKMTGAVGKSVALSYVTIKAVGKSLAMSYGLGAATKAVALPYSVRAFVGKSVSLPYPVRTVVGKSVALPYPVRKFIGRSVSLGYGIGGVVTATRSLPYAIRAFVGKPLAQPYTVYRAVPKSLAQPYKMIVFVGASRTLPYGMVALVSVARSLPYKLTGTIGKSVSLQYGMVGRLGKSLVLPYGTWGEAVLPIGRTSIGTTQYVVAADTKRVVRWMWVSGYFAKVAIYLDGQGGGDDAVCRCIVYGADGLAGESNEVAVPAGAEPGWREFVFDGGLWWAGGQVEIGLHAGGGSPTIRVYGDPAATLTRAGDDLYSDGAEASFGPATESLADFSTVVTYFPRWQPPLMTDIEYARLPFNEAQAKLAETGPEPTLVSAVVGWHGSRLNNERGSVAIVRSGGPLDGYVGERVRVIYDSGGVEHSVVAFVHTRSAKVLDDISLPRRSYLALAPPALVPLQAQIEVLT